LSDTQLKKEFQSQLRMFEQEFACLGEATKHSDKNECVLMNEGSVECDAVKILQSANRRSFFSSASCEYFALQIGLSYIDMPQRRLAGCIRDIENLSNFFDRRQVRFSTHVVCSDQSTSINATQKLGGSRDDIFAGMKLITDAMSRSVAANKFLFLNFSGHGMQVHDEDGDEADGFDEAICPCDFEHAGAIIDDELSRWLEMLPPHRLFAVCDCCHSGTCLDLGEFSGFFGSGCRDDQVSADAKSAGSASGAFTACILHALSSGDCSPAEASSRIRESLLQAGLAQDPVMQCTTSSVLDGWGCDFPKDAVLGLQLEATGTVRAVDQHASADNVCTVSDLQRISQDLLSIVDPSVLNELQNVPNGELERVKFLVQSVMSLKADHEREKLAFAQQLS